MNPLYEALTRHQASPRTVHLLAGVPASGKSWVASQVADRYDHLPHDQIIDAGDYAAHLIRHAHQPGKPILAEAPFRVQALTDALQNAGVPVKTYHLDIDPQTAARRYAARTGRAYPAQHLNNLHRYAQRAWDQRGSSDEIARLLKE